MNQYSQYLRRKALLEFCDGLSDSDKALLMEHFVGKNGMQPIEPRQCRNGFIRGVGENVVGNAVYDIALGLGKTLLKNIRL